MSRIWQLIIVSVTNVFIKYVRELSWTWGRQSGVVLRCVIYYSYIKKMEDNSQQTNLSVSLALRDVSNIWQHSLTDNGERQQEVSWSWIGQCIASHHAPVHWWGKDSEWALALQQTLPENCAPWERWMITSHGLSCPYWGQSGWWMLRAHQEILVGDMITGRSPCC